MVAAVVVTVAVVVVMVWLGLVEDVGVVVVEVRVVAFVPVAALVLVSEAVGSVGVVRAG